MCNENPSDGLFTIICKCGCIFPAEDGKCSSCQETLGDLCLDVDKMLNRIYELNSTGKPISAIDVVCDVYWHLFDKFDIMNNILEKVDVNKLAPSVLTAFLMQTFKYIKQVPNHLIFCDRVEAKLREDGESEKRINNLTARYRTTGDYWESMEQFGAPIWLSGPKPKE